MTSVRELWVCFESPPTAPPRDAIILSFLAPGVEASLVQQYGAQVVSARAIVQETRPRARAEYVRLIARIGSTPCVGELTLRQALKGSGNYSRWWLLDFTEKDCLSDDDTTYLTLLRLTAIQAVKEQFHIERLRLHGVPTPLAVALGQNTAWAHSLIDLAQAVALGCAGRVMLVMEFVSLWWTLRQLRLPDVEPRDVLLHGYWDWSVQPDADGRLRDRYFTSLPQQLAGSGVRVGWLATVETRSTPWQPRRKRRDVVAASRGHRDIILLERFLTPRDIVGTATSLRDAIAATRAVFGPRFRRLCRVHAFDMYPLMRRLVLRAAWGATVCRLQLVATATAGACRRIRPAAVLTAFELFVRARAVYAGVRAGSPSTAVWAAQHAGYSSDKTLGVVDPAVELRGEPDDCAMPAPDGIFAMGDLSARIWHASGFAPERVVVTGGLRYHDVRIESRATPRSRRDITVLLAGSVGEAAHLDLCDAALAATSGMPGVRLQWRDHPYYRFSQRRVFDRFRRIITVTTTTLDEDLRDADLVLFSQSGVGEEALLRGIPTWQWLWPGFNASPFLDVPVIPTFTSVTELRRELEAFAGDPSRYRPAIEAQHRVRDECFGPDPAGAASRIAAAVRWLIGRDSRVYAC